MNSFYPLYVSKIIQETPNAVSLVFSIPENLKEKFIFKAGQYITIKHTIKGEEIRRAYSICSSPNEKDLKIGIKKVEGGRFSVFANEQLQEGAVLKVMPPQGRFVVEPKKNQGKNYVAFAAGSGITPILSIIKTILKEDKTSKILLIYGNKTVVETMYYSELNDLNQKYQDRFLLEFIFSQSQEKNALFGRIENSIINFFLKNKHKDIVFNEFYICGPETMINEINANLSANGVKKEHIYYELFTSSEEDTNASETAVLDGNTKITVTVDEETHSFTLPQNKLVLDAALEKDLDVPYSCRGGICSSCIAKVIEGKVRMVKNQILTDDEIEQGYILTCQSYPVSSTLEIDFDEV